MTPFITATSGGGEFYVTIKVSSLDELHRTHDTILSAFSPTDTQEGLGDAMKARVIAWQGYFPGAGSINSETNLTKSEYRSQEWERDGATVTALVTLASLTACQQEVERLRTENAALSADGIAGRKAAGRNAARAETAEGRNAELQQEVETLREGIKEIAEREQSIRDNWVRREAETGARILELEADLEIANDKLRKMVKALASVTHQLRGWQPEEVALDSDLMEDAPAIERALRVLGRAER